MSLKDKKVLVGLTGGIACYKIPYLIRFLNKGKAETKVVMTSAATKFITPLTLETVSNNPVATEMFPTREFVATHHIDLAEWADLVIVAPATANFMGKIASGISDDLLTTIICATARPVMIAPAMNPQMWANPITQKNLAVLKEFGFMFIGPTEGEMACDHYGMGRMVEPEQLYEAIKQFFSKSSRQLQSPKSSKKKGLEGKKVLITAGPTRESIDPVRYLSNYSSGKMGYALAEAAIQLGAETTLISGPTDLQPPSNVRLIAIESTDDLYKAVKKEFAENDCLIMAAAPVDFTPQEIITQKIKKKSNGYKLLLKPTVDILKEISYLKKKHQLVIGFALETENGLFHARTKLKEKNLDMIILNQPGQHTGFNSDTNRITILIPGKKPVKLPLRTKFEISMKILDYLSSML